MAVHSEEDYLDSLLKSITESKESVSDDVNDTEFGEQADETFKTPEVEEDRSDIYQQIDEDELNPMAVLFDNNEAQSWQELDEDTEQDVEDILAEAEAFAEENLSELFADDDVQEEIVEEEAAEEELAEEEHVEEESAENEIAVGEYFEEELAEEEFAATTLSEPSEDELIDNYIQKVLSDMDEESVDEAVSEETATLEEVDETFSVEGFSESDMLEEDIESATDSEFETDSAFEIDSEFETDSAFEMNSETEESDNNLIGMLDGIFNDVEDEMQNESDESYMEEGLEAFMSGMEDPMTDAVEDASLDDIMDNPLEEFMSEDMGDTVGEPEADLNIDFSTIPVDDELKELLGVDSPEDLENLQENAEGLSEEEIQKLNALESENSIETVPEDSQDNKEAESKTKKGSQVKKAGLFAAISSLFKKKKTEPVSAVANENQQVLDELFDENGELLGDEKKVKKKGLFSKSKKPASDAVESPITGAEGFVLEGLENIEELEEIPEAGKKEKKKKEKKKKEPKEKKAKKEKPKKAKKPKVKKEKVPPSPSELISVKPVVILLMLVAIAGISGYAYFFVNSFTYNQAMDEATYYLVDKKYTFAYESIAGVEAKKEEDIALQEQITTIMYVQKQYNSYERYVKMNMAFEAIDSLIKGIREYDKHYETATQMGIAADMDQVKELIVAALQQYGITEDMARGYGAITDYAQYVYILETYGGIVE